MELQLFEILKKCQGFKIHQERELTEKRVELIIYRKDYKNWISIFSEHLGAPAKPEGQKPTAEHLTITEPYGGINKHQTLFFNSAGDQSAIIMIWPWGDDEHMTLHMLAK